MENAILCNSNNTMSSSENSILLTPKNTTFYQPMETYNCLTDNKTNLNISKINTEKDVMEVKCPNLSLKHTPDCVIDEPNETASPTKNKIMTEVNNGSPDSLVASLNKVLEDICSIEEDKTMKSQRDESAASIAAREQQESEELARQLMAEEAMASYFMSSSSLHDNADHFSEEDYAAIQIALNDESNMVEDIDEMSNMEEEEDLSYETMLRLGNQIGDVKEERWALVAKERINSLPIRKYDISQKDDEDEGNDCTSKCLVCQSNYDNGDNLRVLPCGHCFHSECVDIWLLKKDYCPYCRRSIVTEDA